MVTSIDRVLGNNGFHLVFHAVVVIVEAEVELVAFALSLFGDGALLSVRLDRDCV